jgi:hypothetical protein
VAVLVLGDVHLDAIPLAFAHVLDGVANQIGEHLIQARPIAVDERGRSFR